MANDVGETNVELVVQPETVVEVDTSIWPTGKPHISFSELSNWIECGWRYRLLYIERLGTEGGLTPHVGFGTAVHDANENYLKTRVMDVTIAHDIMSKWWKDHEDAFVNGPFPDWSPEGYGSLDDWHTIIDRILADVPGFLDEKFPGWKCFGAEEYLYETIEGHPIKFKGFIDGALEVVDARGKKKYYLIDWKTCGWGWSVEKKRDFNVQLQLILYKNYWSKKHNIDPRDVKCAFVLLKRDGRPGKSIDIVPVSVGPSTSAKGLRVIDNYARAINRGFFLKNRNSCRFCEFNNTEHCKLDL